MTVEECKNKIRGYTKFSKDTLEIAMNIIECNDELADIENDEINILYKKLSDVVKILESI